MTTALNILPISCRFLADDSGIENDIETRLSTVLTDDAIEQHLHEAVLDFEIPWGMYDVLIVDWVGQDSYRLGIGYCYVEAFYRASPRKRVMSLI